MAQYWSRLLRSRTGTASELCVPSVGGAGVSSHPMLIQSSPQSSMGCWARSVPFPQRMSSAGQKRSQPQQMRSGWPGRMGNFTAIGTRALVRRSRRLLARQGPGTDGLRTPCRGAADERPQLDEEVPRHEQGAGGEDDVSGHAHPLPEERRVVERLAARVGEAMLIHRRELRPAYWEEVENDPERQTAVVEPERPAAGLLAESVLLARGVAQAEVDEP